MLPIIGSSGLPGITLSSKAKLSTTELAFICRPGIFIHTTNIKSSLAFVQDWLLVYNKASPVAGAATGDLFLPHGKRPLYWQIRFGHGITQNKRYQINLQAVYSTARIIIHRRLFQKCWIFLIRAA